MFPSDALVRTPDSEPETSYPYLHTAPDVHLPDLTWSETKPLIATVLRVLRDSTRIEDIMMGEELSAGRQLVFLLDSGIFDSEHGHEIWNQRPELSDTDFQKLRKLPDNTLGSQFARHIEENELDYSEVCLGAKYIPDPDLAYMMRRIRQSHDVWHALLGLGIEAYEEVLIHVFTLAQLGLPSNAVIAFLGMFKHMVFEGRIKCLRHELPLAYRAGASAPPLLSVMWERHWEDPIDEVRLRYGLPVIGTG